MNHTPSRRSFTNGLLAFAISSIVLAFAVLSVALPSFVAADIRDFRDTYKLPYAGAVPRSLKDRLEVYIDDFGAVGGDAIDDTQAFRDAAAIGRTILLRPYAYYLLSGRISPVANSKFKCPQGECIVRIKTGAGGYSSVNLAAVKSDVSVCVFLFLNVDGVALEGISFETDGAQEAVIYPVALYGGTDVKGASFKRLKFTGFAAANGGLLGLNSVGEGGAVVEDIEGRDIGTALGNDYWSGANMQITVLCIDADRTAGDSRYISIRGLRGIDMLLSGDALADYGAGVNQQTDVLNTQGNDGPFSADDIYGENVGEVVDIFSSHGVYTGIKAKNAWVVAAKVVHGAAGNHIVVDDVNGAGFAAVAAAGSDSVARHTTRNLIEVGNVRGVGDIGGWGSPSIVRIMGNGATGSPKLNTFIVRGDIEGGANVDFAVTDEAAADTGNDNYVEFQRGRNISVATRLVSITYPNNTRVRFKESTDVYVRVASNQSVISDNTARKVNFDTAVRDRLSEFNPTTDVTRTKTPGTKHIVCQLYVSGVNAADRVILWLRLNGVVVAAESINAEGDGTISVEFDQIISEAIAGQAGADIEAYYQITSAATPTILADPTLTFLQITDKN